MTAPAPADPVALLGAYILPGRVDDPRPGIAQAQAGEEIGLGSIWVSDRWDTKEISAVCGALTQVVRRPKIICGATHFGTRHPLVLAGMATTLQTLSDDRFVLGIARSAGNHLRQLGIPVPTNAALADHAMILRRLWAGETFSYDGPAGHYPVLRLPDVPGNGGPPLILAAIGPKALALAGASFDGVILTPFLTPEGVRKSSNIVRNAALEAGRDPAAIRVYATVVVAPDLPSEEQEAVVGGRAVTYFQSPEVARLVVAMNDWDPDTFDRLQAHPQFSVPGSADQEFRREQLVAASRLIPQHLLNDGAAVGTASECADRLRVFFEAGADEVLLHGATPDQCGELVKEFRSLLSN